MSLRYVAALAAFLFFSCSTVIAQVPSGALLWLDANDLDTGQRIAQWPDKSGRGHHAVMPNIDLRPAIVQVEGDNTKTVEFLWGRYLELPHIFPTISDYSAIVVMRLHDTTNVNNLLSGDHHAYWFDGSARPGIAHDDRFHERSVSEVGVRSGIMNIVYVQYREATGQAGHYINGLFGDSLYVGPNHDSTLYIGSYQRGYFANGNFAELLLYPRILTEVERTTLENHLFTKYGLTRPAPLPKPDSTFTHLPKSLQLFPRGDDDSATVEIKGTMYATGYDSIVLKKYKNSYLIDRESQPFIYEQGKAPFSFETRIKAELQEYAVEVFAKRQEHDSLMVRRNGLVAGDVFIIGGASNATFGAWSWRNENPFCRTFGMNLSRNPRDTAWAMSEVDPWGFGPSVSSWGASIQQLIAERYQIPTCIVNWGAGGTILTHHLKKSENLYDLGTIYGRLMYRLDKAGLRNHVKAHIFWHGELNNLEEYPAEFYDLYRSLSEDLPSLGKTYLIQLRPSFCSNMENMDLREWQRLIQDSLPRLETISTTALENYDGCHYNDEGGRTVGERFFKTIARDFYGASDTAFLRSPTLRQAYYKNGKFDEITLEFEPTNYDIQIRNDGSFNGVAASIRDYIYLDTTWGKVVGMTAIANRIVVKLSEPIVASTISWLPDRYYHGTEVIYQGPWLTTESGIGVMAFQNVPITVKSAVTISNNGMFSLYPNPSYGAVMIEGDIDSMGPVQLEAYDNLGRRVMSDAIHASNGKLSYPLSTKDLDTGVYTLRIRTLESEHVLKLVVVN